MSGTRSDPGPGPRPIRIGLTGPIGCGKSTVARWLADRGAVVIDADEVARSVTAPGRPAHAAVLARFGDPVRGADGVLDRAALARIVFADPVALRALEAIVHPVVRPIILATLENAEKGDAPAIVIEAIKLVEGGLADLCDEVWLVTCDPLIQSERIIGRGAEPTDADRRIAAQGNLVERLLPAADRVLDTSGSVADTRARLTTIWQEAVASRA